VKEKARMRAGDAPRSAAHHLMFVLTADLAEQS